MNLFSRHLTGLFDFKGRENRQPFWLWVLVCYGFQMVVGLVISIPLMMNYMNAFAPMMGRDQTYLNEHPELARQIIANAMMPFMRGMMVVSVVMALLFALLLAAAVVRRLHDGDRSGWWASPVFAMQVLFPLIYAAIFPRFFDVIGNTTPDMRPEQVQAQIMPLMQTIAWTSVLGMVGFLMMIVLIVFLCLPGTVGPNRHGPDPLFYP